VRRLIGIGLLLVVLAVSVWAIRLLWLAGTFRRIQPHFAGTCRLVPGPVGPEDITIHPRTGVAYVSASDRRAVMAGRAVPGAIWAYDLNATDPVPLNLTPHSDTRFQPHGISLWAGADGRDALFVVNHPVDGDTPLPNAIEIFDVTDHGLLHRATLTDPLLVMPNDLVAVALDRFYVTNTHRHPPGSLQTVETYLQLAEAQVVFYGPGGFRPALEDLLFPNGINVSPDGRTLYVASTTGRSVRAYDRDPASEALHFRQEIGLGSGADNIEIDEHGNLWIGAHPKLLRVEAHGKDPKTLSPSQVLRVTPAGAVEEIYLDDGSAISTSTVGAVHGDRLLIGNVFDDGFLDCRMTGPAASGADS
jgi:arylesterase / paraoxonase